MMELLLVVCLQITPDRCEERSIGLYPQMSAMTCLMQAQPQIAAWTQTHPGLTVSRFTCRDSATRFSEA
jgi:hypothetical protein